MTSADGAPCNYYFPEGELIEFGEQGLEPNSNNLIELPINSDGREIALAGIIYLAKTIFSMSYGNMAYVYTSVFGYALATYKNPNTIKNMQIAYIGVPIALGADRKGVELAPDFFRNEGVVKMLDHICGCYDLGNVQSSIIAEEKHAADPAVKYLSTIVDISSQLRDKVASVIRQGYFPLIVGGDHSLGLGSVAGAALAYDDIAVIWFDAHGDFNTEETSPTGNLHGMPAAAAMGWCKSELSSVATKTIPPRNFFWIGARDLDEGEKAFAEKNNLHIYSAENVRQRGMLNIMDEIIQILQSNSISHIHLSVDIDGMDPSIVCGTGTKVDKGINNGQFYTFIDKIFSTNKVISADFVEYNHLLDDENRTTATWCKEALHYLSTKIKLITK